MVTNISGTRFLEWLDRDNFSARTIKEYGIYYNKLLTFGEISQGSIDLFLRHNKNGVARAFVKKLLRFIIKNEKELGLTPDELYSFRNIDIEPMRRRERKEPRFLTKDEVIKLYQGMKSEGSRIMVLLSFYCGLRASELLAIKIKHFNWDEWNMDHSQNGKLTIVKGKGGKTATVPLKPFLMKKTSDWVNEVYTPHGDKFNPDQPIFPLNYEQWKHILKKTGLEVFGRRINAHSLRHAIGRHLRQDLEWDITEVQRFLRHKDISSTQIYAQVSLEHIDKKYKEI